MIEFIHYINRYHNFNRMHLVSKINFLKANFFSIAFALIPFSFIAGNMIVNINIISLIIATLIIHNKKCETNQNCAVNEIDSNIKFELTKSILAKAALLEKNTKTTK